MEWLLKGLLKDGVVYVIKKLLTIKTLKKILELFKFIAYVSVLIGYYYFFLLDRNIINGNRDFVKSRFDVSFINEMNSSVERLYNSCYKKSEGGICKNYLFISLIELACNEDNKRCSFNWKHVVGFNEGEIKNFEQIISENRNYSPTVKQVSLDNLDKIRAFDKSVRTMKIRQDDTMLDQDENLKTHISWLRQGRTNYKISYIKYIIIPYEKEENFYILQIVSDNLNPDSFFEERGLLNQVFVDLKTRIINFTQKWNIRFNNSYM